MKLLNFVKTSKSMIFALGLGLGIFASAMAYDTANTIVRSGGNLDVPGWTRSKNLFVVHSFSTNLYVKAFDDDSVMMNIQVLKNGQIKAVRLTPDKSSALVEKLSGIDLQFSQSGIPIR